MRFVPLGVISAQGPAGLRFAIAALHVMQDQWPELARAALHGMPCLISCVSLVCRPTRSNPPLHYAEHLSS